jgi:hypothetical protein
MQTAGNCNPGTHIQAEVVVGHIAVEEHMCMVVVMQDMLLVH